METGGIRLVILQRKLDELLAQNQRILELLQQAPRLAGPSIEEVNKALLEGSLLLTQSGIPVVEQPSARTESQPQHLIPEDAIRSCFDCLWGSESIQGPHCGPCDNNNNWEEQIRDCSSCYWSQEPAGGLHCPCANNASWAKQTCIDCQHHGHRDFCVACRQHSKWALRHLPGMILDPPWCDKLCSNCRWRAEDHITGAHCIPCVASNEEFLWEFPVPKRPQIIQIGQAWPPSRNQFIGVCQFCRWLEEDRQREPCRSCQPSFETASTNNIIRTRWEMPLRRTKQWTDCQLEEIYNQHSQMICPNWDTWKKAKVRLNQLAYKNPGYFQEYYLKILTRQARGATLPWPPHRSHPETWLHDESPVFRARRITIFRA
jgi:hypothetical protein